jgi:hypothetical protein
MMEGLSERTMVKGLFCEFPEIPCFYSNFSHNAEIPAEFHTVGIPYRWNSIPLEFIPLDSIPLEFHGHPTKGTKDLFGSK